MLPSTPRTAWDVSNSDLLGTSFLFKEMAEMNDVQLRGSRPACKATHVTPSPGGKQSLLLPLGLRVRCALSCGHCMWTRIEMGLRRWVSRLSTFQICVRHICSNSQDPIKLNAVARASESQSSDSEKGRGDRRNPEALGPATLAYAAATRRLCLVYYLEVSDRLVHCAVSLLTDTRTPART